MKTEKITVWAGLWSKGIIGPYFFEENVNGDNYLTMLNDYFYPSYCNLPNDKLIFFMHDGAPPHYALKVREWLDQNLSGHRIGHRSSVEWPARSPDLTPADYFMWGHVEDLVYKDEPRNSDSLKKSIIRAFDMLDASLCGLAELRALPDQVKKTRTRTCLLPRILTNTALRLRCRILLNGP